MSQISKRILNPQIQKRLYENFWQMLADIKNAKETRLFLEDFLSPTEKVMLAKRMAIALLFAKGFDHRSISSLLKVSTSTVNNIAKLLHLQSPSFKLLIIKYMQKESNKEFLQSLEKYFFRLQPGKHFVDEGLIKAKLGHKKELF